MIMVHFALMQLATILVGVTGLRAAAISSRGDSATVTQRSAVLYQNNGNWTAHAENPSAILFFDPVSFTDAQDICASNGESLINESDLETFKLPLQYQAYLGSISASEKYWVASSSASDCQVRPFICTNTAPYVAEVQAPFYSFPKVGVLSNGTTYVGVRDHLAYRFLGLPYALQPVGDLRLAYPIEWYTNETNYVLNATTYGPTCPASGGYYDGNTYGLNPWGNSEACLLMNIFTPYLPGSQNPDNKTLKPVLFWLHGGGGTAMDATFDGASLASRSDVVLVSINWRGSNFGSLSFNDGFVDGNYGIADIVMGLQFVRDHIKAFGGDPDKVTVFGQSAGGESAMAIVKSPKANGLFWAAILMSAAIGPAVTQEEVSNVTVPAVAKVCGDAVGAERLACLRALPLDEFMSNITWSVAPGWRNVDSGAIIDGVWIANNSVAAAKAGQLNRIHYMMGSMPEEGESLLGTNIYPNATDFNTTLYSVAGTNTNSNSYPEDWPPLVESSGLWTNGSDPINAYNMTINAYTTVHLTCPGQQFLHAAYQYNAFESIYYYNNLRAYALSFYNPWGLCSFPVGEPNTPYYRCHSGDLYQVFGSYQIFDLPVRTPDDIGHSNLQQDLWGAFARTGNPNPDKDYLEARGYAGALALFDRVQWPQFNGSSGAINLDYPNPSIGALPWADKCSVVQELYQVP
ncbi:carboxylesterase [Xylariales sp. PMI_506]|nr:carboxylesterase [Xylariales sp. PMI_506]